MKDRRALKRKNLREAGILNPDPGRVQEPVFQEWPAFFDPEDNLQVHYEMLRAHGVDEDSVSAICLRFGVSRQTFYNLQEKFRVKGTVGLLPQRPGPRGPSKMTEEVLAFVEQHVKADDVVSTAMILIKVQAKFGMSVHRRTLEKLIRDLRSKKNG